jgi:hypothetical protein
VGDDETRQVRELLAKRPEALEITLLDLPRRFDFDGDPTQPVRRDGVRPDEVRELFGSGKQSAMQCPVEELEFERIRESLANERRLPRLARAEEQDGPSREALREALREGDDALEPARKTAAVSLNSMKSGGRRGGSRA